MIAMRRRYEVGQEEGTMTRYFPAETIHKWGTALLRIYERRGPKAFERYQYILAKIIQIDANGKLGGKLLEYAKNITNPKEVLFDALTAIMRDDLASDNARILAIHALRTLLPRRMPHAIHIGQSIERAMRDVTISAQTSVLHEIVNDALQFIITEVTRNSLKQTLLFNATRA